MIVPEATPATTVTGEDVKVSCSTGPGATTRVAEVVLVAPEVGSAEMVSGYVPAGVVAVVVIVNVELVGLPVSVTGLAGLNTAEAPVGKPLTLNVVLRFPVPVEVNVIAYVALEFTTTGLGV